MKKLEARLTLLFTSLVALVLFLALCVTYYITLSQYSANAERVMQATFTAVTDKLIADSNISDTWLAQQEIASNSIIYIEDNGSSLLFSGSWTPSTSRDVLINKAKGIARDMGVVFSPSSLSRTVSFQLKGEQGEKYNGIARIIKLHTKYIGALIIQDEGIITSYAVKLALQYVLLWLVAVVILCIICRILAHLAVKPAVVAARQQAEFVAAASHELRSPLAVIIASLDAAQECSEQAPSFIATAKGEGKHMVSLIDDMLLLASGDAKSWHMTLSDTAPENICIELYEQYYHLAKNSGHTLCTVLPNAPLPHISADKSRLLQLFAILLDNALEYTPSGTLIEIIAAVEHNRLVFKIADHGFGISDDDKGKIFTRFYRGDKSRTDKEHFGLGLSIATQIAMAHGATLSVEDTFNGGATFTLIFYSNLTYDSLF